MIIWGIFSVLLLIISLNDFLFFRIEDENILCLIALYIVSCLFGITGNNILMDLFSASIAFSVAFVMNQLNWIGGGDVKLLFPLVLFAGGNLSCFILGISVAGLILAIIYLIIPHKINLLRKYIIQKLQKSTKNKNKSRMLSIVLLSLSRMKKSEFVNGRITARSLSVKSLMKQEIPYGIALSCGGLCVMLENMLARW